MGRTSLKSALAVLLAIALVAPMTGCGKKTGGDDTAQRSKEMTAGQFPDTTPPAPEMPPPPMLKTPKSAVFSYLLYISYAYRILNSDVASQTFSPYEEVRVNSYVEYNRQQGRAIDQRLVNFDIRGVTSKGETVTVAAKESWRYRYIDTSTGNYKGEPLDASYDTTYTVVKNAKGKWVVGEVAASPVGEPPH